MVFNGFIGIFMGPVFPAPPCNKSHIFLYFFGANDLCEGQHTKEDVEKSNYDMASGHIKLVKKTDFKSNQNSSN